MAAHALVEIAADLIAVDPMRNQRRLLAIGAAELPVRRGLLLDHVGRGIDLLQPDIAAQAFDDARLRLVLRVTKADADANLERIVRAQP